MTDKELKTRMIGYRLYCRDKCWGTICNVVFHRNPANYCTIKTTSEGADDHSPRNSLMRRDEMEALCEDRVFNRTFGGVEVWKFELKPSNNDN